MRSFYGPFSRTTLVSSAASQTNESEAEIMPAAEGLQGRLGRCRLGRAPVVTDDDIRASPFADGSEREPIVSRHARGSSHAGVRNAAAETTAM